MLVSGMSCLRADRTLGSPYEILKALAAFPEGHQADWKRYLERNDIRGDVHWG
jgi:hypothetical protein